MREIKFRGKRISNGSWVYGGIYKTFHPNYDSDCYAICADGRDYFVEQNTIGQFTGLYDKYDKKIFTGDIVNFLGQIGEVVFEKGAFGIGFNDTIDWSAIDESSPLYEISACKNDNFISLWEIYWNFNDEDDILGLVEVIGNVFEDKIK